MEYLFYEFKEFQTSRIQQIILPISPQQELDNRPKDVLLNQQSSVELIIRTQALSKHSQGSYS